MIYEDMQVFKDSKYPFVMLYNSFTVNDADTVAINNFSGVRNAINYLVQKGIYDAGLSVPKDVFGNNCVDLLVGKINNYRPYALKMEIGTILIERDSVRALHE